MLGPWLCMHISMYNGEGTCFANNDIGADNQAGSSFLPPFKMGGIVDDGGLTLILSLNPKTLTLALTLMATFS